MKNIILVLTAVAFILLAFTQCNKDCIKSDRCNLEPDPGLCEAYIPKYFYDNNDKTCKEFIWGGCGGVVPFDTMEECEEQCSCN